MKKNDITRALLIAAVCAAALFTAGCAASSDSSKAESKPDKTDSPAEIETSDGRKVEVYLDEDGTPYYIDSDGSKMMLFSTPFADPDDDDDPDDFDDDPFEDYDYTEDFIRGEYDQDNLKFTVPDGWFAENSFGTPILFQDFDDVTGINYDEYISIVPVSFVFDPNEDGVVNEDMINAYFKELTDAGFYTEYDMLETGEISFSGIEANYYDIAAKIEDDELTETFRTRYIITAGDNSHCFILESLDDDASFKKVLDAFDSFSGTITLPTAEQMEQGFEW